jgi:CheY-like chemotaxis protein
MISVLVVDDDAPLRKALTRELRANGYDSFPANGYDEAIQRLREQTYDVLLTDLRMGDKDGLDLIRALAESFPTTRPILMSAYATARDSEQAVGLGAVRVLCKPFDSSELLQAVERAAECTNGFFGTVHGLALIDMLQMFHHAQRSLTVRVLGGAPAAIHMQRGQIVHATYGSTEGEEALAEMLAMPAGSLQTSSLEPVAPTLSREFQPLMLDLLRRMDERRRGDADPPSPARGASSASAWSGSDGSGGAAWLLDDGTHGDAPDEMASLSPEATDGRGNEQARPESGLLADACKRTLGQLTGDVVCAVVDLDSGALLGCHAGSAGGWRRCEALARATVALFRSAVEQDVGALLAGADTSAGRVDPSIRRLELTTQDGLYIARATRRGRRVMGVLVGRGGDAAAARTQLDAVFPLVEALLP